MDEPAHVVDWLLALHGAEQEVAEAKRKKEAARNANGRR